METEEFENEREFNRKYPGGLYICPMCDRNVTSPIYCPYCGFRADGIFKTMNRGYRYRIKGKEETEIFRPIESTRQERSKEKNV